MFPNGNPPPRGQVRAGSIIQREREGGPSPSIIQLVPGIRTRIFSHLRAVTGKPDGLEKGSTLDKIVMRGFLPEAPPPVG